MSSGSAAGEADSSSKQPSSPSSSSSWHSKSQPDRQLKRARDPAAEGLAQLGQAQSTASDSSAQGSRAHSSGEQQPRKRTRVGQQAVSGGQSSSTDAAR